MFRGIGYPGSSIYGGLTEGVQTELPINPPAGPTIANLLITIQGIDYTDNLLVNTLRITDEVNSRNTCQLQIVDITQLLHPDVGQVIQISNYGSLIFAGTIAEVTEQNPLGSDTNIVMLQCVDWNQLADRHVLAVKYATGYSLREVVVDILTVQSGDPGERLIDEGITYSTMAPNATIDEGPDLSILIFSYQTCAEAFDDLSELTGFAWNIGYDKRFYFYDRSSQIAPVPLDVDLWPYFRDLTVHETAHKYRNFQIVRAGNDITNTQTETFLGDGETATFTLKLPVAETPSSIKVNSVSKTIGIQSVDEDKDWYYKIDEDTITQDSDAAALTDSQVLEVQYRGFFPIINIARLEDADIGTRDYRGRYWNLHRRGVEREDQRSRTCRGLHQ